MNWQDFQLKHYDLTKAEVRAMSRKVIDAYREAIRSIGVQLEKTYANLSGVAPENYYNEMIKYDRLKNLLAGVRSEYMAYSQRAQRYIEASSYVSFSNEYYRSLYALSWVEPFTVGMIPPKLAELAIYGIENQVKRLEKIYGPSHLYRPKAGTLISFIKANRTAEINKIQSAITQGLLQGKGYQDVYQSIKHVIGNELKVGGKINYTGAKANALRIIRTESNRTANAGAYAATKYADSVGVEVKRRILSTLDGRTRSQSAQVDGQTVGVDEPFIYPGGVEVMYPGSSGRAEWDINDRETVIDVIPGLEPIARIGRNPATGENEVFGYKDFPVWAKEVGLKKNVYGEYYGS